LGPLCEKAEKRGSVLLSLPGGSKLGGTLIFPFEVQHSGMLPLHRDFCGRVSDTPKNGLKVPPHTNMAAHQAKKE
jgi:hypothetical protein